MHARRRCQTTISVFFVAFCTAGAAADIYRTENGDGSFSYSNVRLDSRYTLYLRGDSNKGVPSTGAVQSRNSPPSHLAALIDHFAKKHHVDPDLVRAIAETESSFNPAARSPKGAAGIMQLMPNTAARYGVTQRSDPAQNIEAGVRYLKDLLVLHNGNVALALAAYNAGEGTVARHGKRIPPYRETMLYVPVVLTRAQAAPTSTSSQSIQR